MEESWKRLDEKSRRKKIRGREPEEGDHWTREGRDQRRRAGGSRSEEKSRWKEISRLEQDRGVQRRREEIRPGEQEVLGTTKSFKNWYVVLVRKNYYITVL